MTRLFNFIVLITIGAAAVAAQNTDRTLIRTTTASERRVALVVGNDSYAGAALSNGRNDAKSVAAALREVGFQVTLLEDATQATLNRAVADLGDSVGPSDVAFFYFAGHGVQIGGENYLIPVDYRGASPTAARLTTLAASDVQEALGKARVSILVLDACRNNPYSGQRAGGGGLAAMEARGSLVAFATGAGQTAADNAGQSNGLFTLELLRTLREPNLSARDVFYRTRQRVFDASKGRQFPAVYDGLLGEFVFRPGTTTAPVVSSADAELLRQREEIAFWESIPASGEPQRLRPLLEEYERRYGPNGRFSLIARDRLGAFKPAVSPLPTAPATFALKADQLTGATIAALTSDCDRGHAAACNEAGRRYRFGTGIGRDDARAAALYQRGCDGSDAVACTNAGFMFERGLGVAPDDGRAAAFYQRGCEGGNPLGCNNWGYMFEAGRGVARDVARSVAVYQRGCEGGNALGCTNWGGAYQEGRGVARDDARALALYQRGCEGGDGGGCTNWGLMYENGRGVTRDNSRAVALYQRGCEAGDASGCTNWGYMYDIGLGVVRDDARAVALYQRGCEGGNARGCSNWGYMYDIGRGVTRDDARAVALYQRGCEGGNARGCTNWGVMYENGRGVPRDEARAAGLYQRGCEGGHAIGCSNWGYMLETGRGVARDEARAVAVYQRGCEGGDARGCTNWGGMYREGKGVTRDDARAATLYQRGCEGGSGRGCTNWGYMVETGRGVASNSQRAIELYRRGCQAGDEEGCSYEKRLLAAQPAR